MREWVIRWWLDIVMGGVVALLGFGYRRLRRRVKAASGENEALKAGIKALLRDRIVRAYNDYMDKGCWPIYAREAVMDMFTQYKALGGNGVIPGLLEDLKKLPTEKKGGQDKH